MFPTRAGCLVPLLLALATVPCGAFAATRVHVVDQHYTPAAANSTPGIQTLDIPIQTAGGRNAQAFIPILDNVTFAYVWGDPGTMPGRVHLATAQGAVMGVASLAEPTPQPSGLRRAFFPNPVAVTPGEVYTLDFEWSLPPSDVVFPVAYRLQGGSPGGYPFANAVLEGTPDPRVDFFFVEGGLARQLPQTGALPQQQPGDVRVALRTHLQDAATQSRWEFSAGGSSSFLLTGDHAGEFTTAFDAASSTTSTRFELHLPDDGNGVVDNRWMSLSILDRVTLKNETGTSQTVAVQGGFDAFATFAAGASGNASVTTFFVVDGEPQSTARSYAPGQSVDIAQSGAPFLIDVPANAELSFDVNGQLVITAPEGSMIASLNSFTLAYDLPEGVTMTSLFAAAPVPEPRSMALMAAGIALLAWRSRRRG